MQRLWIYIRRYRLRYAVGIFATLATVGFANVLPYLYKLSINSIERGQFARLPRYTLLICGIAILAGAARWFSRFVTFNVARDIEYDMRNDLFAHLTTLGPNFYERMKTGDLMSRLINDLTLLRMLFGMVVLSFTDAPVRYVVALTIMMSLNTKLALASVLPYMLLLVSMRQLTRTLMERSLRVQEGLGAIGSKIQESLAGVHVVKAYTLEDHDAKLFKQLNDAYNEQGLALARVRGAMFPMIRTAAASSLMIVLIYGGTIVVRGQMTIGDLVAFMSYLSQLAWPMTSLAWTISIYQRARAAMKRLGEIFDAEAPKSAAAVNGEIKIQGEIEWDHVSFTYFSRPGESLNGQTPYALRDVSVKVPAGGKLAIVGRTGSGKTTMIKLLVRMMEPTSGRILLDGHDIRELPLPILRSAIGSVPQDAVLFSDTMARNIAFGRADSPFEEIVSAARTAGLESDIMTLPRGLDTIVGERGMSLSGGQKQRVTIARAITYNPAVVVLDDALSSVDTETEKSVLGSLGESVLGRTTIVVAHRASTVRDADEIVVLERGEIAERGTHEELMAMHGIYAELFKRQLMEEELAQY